VYSIQPQCSKEGRKDGKDDERKVKGKKKGRKLTANNERK
jgi:hypothetical protein